MITNKSSRERNNVMLKQRLWVSRCKKGNNFFEGSCLHRRKCTQQQKRNFLLSLLLLLYSFSFLLLIVGCWYPLKRWCQTPFQTQRPYRICVSLRWSRSTDEEQMHEARLYFILPITLYLDNNVIDVVWQIFGTKQQPSNDELLDCNIILDHILDVITTIIFKIFLRDRISIT